MSPASDAADAHAAAILDQVELDSLEATPGTIAPFEASKVSWKVSGPAGFTVLFENVTVAKVGERIVTPAFTQTFRLKARSGHLEQELSAVTVTVDQATCRIIRVPNDVVEQFVRAGVDLLLAENPGTTRRRDDVVTIDASGIDIDLAFRRKVKFKKGGVDITITFKADIEAHWTYVVSNGQLVADFSKLNASVSAPWWAWLIPLSYPGLPIAIAMAEDNSRDDVRKNAAAGADALEGNVEGGLRILTAHFTPTDFEMLACPDGPLKRLMAPGIAVTGVTRRA